MKLNKVRVLFGSGIGLFALLTLVTVVWLAVEGELHQSYVFIMIPTSAVAVMCIFGGFLTSLRTEVAGVREIVDQVAAHEVRIGSHDARLHTMEEKVSSIVEFLVERYGYATGLVDGAVQQEHPGNGSVLRFPTRPHVKKVGD